MSNRLFAMTFVALGLVIFGCGPSGPTIVPVRGKVMIDGKPLTYGYIRFVPSGGRPSDSQIGPDGSFALRYVGKDEGAVLGSHRVEVSANESLSPSSVKWHAPNHYASIGTSGLIHEVTGEDRDVTIDLSWGGKPGPYVQKYGDANSL